MFSNNGNIQYSFYVAYLTYLYCDESMQTVSLVERLISLCSEKWFFIDDDLYSEIKRNANIFMDAADFVSTVYHVDIDPKTSYLSWSYDSFLEILKAHAKSPQVKKYFGL